VKQDAMQDSATKKGYRKKTCTVILALFNSFRKEIQSDQTKNPTIWVIIGTCCDTGKKMSRQTFAYDKWSVATDDVCQLLVTTAVHQTDICWY